MNSYLVLVRGINVGGKNKLSMADLRACLEDLGFSDVSTYIASGNVLLASTKTAAEVKTNIETALPQNFRLSSELIKVHVLTDKQLAAVVNDKPFGFGDQPDKYHSDVIFLIGLDATQTIKSFSPREGVDKVWPGQGVIYSQRLSAERTKSRLNKIMSTPEYKSMTIRTWSTTAKLLALMEQRSIK